MQQLRCYRVYTTSQWTWGPATMLTQRTTHSPWWETNRNKPLSIHHPVNCICITVVRLSIKCYAEWYMQMHLTPCFLYLLINHAGRLNSFCLTSSLQHMGSRAESGKSKGFSCTWDSLRNSAGEKILQLRSHPLGMPSDSNFCSLLNDLSVEQRFDVSYLDLGEFTDSAGLASKEMRSKWTSLATHTNRAACKYNQWDGAYDKLFLGCRVVFGVYASTAFTAFGSIPQINDMQCGFY